MPSLKETADAIKIKFIEPSVCVSVTSTSVAATKKKLNKFYYRRNRHPRNPRWPRKQKKTHRICSIFALLLSNICFIYIERKYQPDFQLISVNDLKLFRSVLFVFIFFHLIH